MWRDIWTETFRSLGGRNYRLWAIGAIVSNVGTWMQRTAQDWLVLTQLTDHSATAVGIVMGLQFGPQALLLPITGYAADKFDKRKLLMATQLIMGLLALGLGILTISGLVQLWQVYIFAFLLGCAAAFDAPARHSFVSELVVAEDLTNAVGLNSASFNAARVLGPAAAGLLITTLGNGGVFLLNAVSYIAVIVSLLCLRVSELHRDHKVTSAKGHFADGFRYVWSRPDLKTISLMLILIGTFGLNFPLFISTMSVSVFGADAHEYGLLMSTMAVGSLAGALLAAGRAKPHMGLLVGGATVFAFGFALAAVMPNYWLFGLTLLLVGISSQTFTTTTISMAQLTTEPAVRGRVMALMIATAMGGTPIGAPFLGWVADAFGPRWALAVGASSGLAAALVGIRYLLKHGGWREYKRISFVSREDLIDGRP